MMIETEILNYCLANPGLEIDDLFKYLHQSCFGCEHLVTDGDYALRRIREEAKNAEEDNLPPLERLCGDFCRVHLTALSGEDGPEALCRAFLLSAGCRPAGQPRLEQCLEASLALAREEKIPFDPAVLAAAIDEWRGKGFPALHHSDSFRDAHHPAYRVVHTRYLPELPLRE